MTRKVFALLAALTCFALTFGVSTAKTPKVLIMQDRGAWIKRQGKGTIFYFLPGHAVSDYENRNVSQIILNAITWSPPQGR